MGTGLNNTAQIFKEYEESFKAKAEELVLKGFPETIVHLNEILETPNFKNPQFIDVSQELNIPIPNPILLNSHNEFPPTKKTKYDNSISQDGANVIALPTGTVPTNKKLQQLVAIVKPHMRKLVEDSNLLKLWISLMIPKIEDGNNFGVSIQEDALAEVEFVESATTRYFDQTSGYFISRGKLISKVTKYPHIDDYRQAVEELDKMMYLSLCYMMTEIRNKYCLLHDAVIKNLDKIKKPRSINAEFLY